VFSYLIIVPALNEERAITRVISGIRSFDRNAGILVVNDGSTDKTSALAAEQGVMVVNHPYNLGYAAALQTGYRFAMKRRYEYIVIMDADGQHDPRSISNLFDAMKTSGADVVIGSRFLEGGYKMGFIRSFGVWMFSKIAWFYTGHALSDPTSGFQLMNRKAYSFLALEDDYPLDYPDINIIMLLHKKRFKMQESPVQMVANKQGTTMHGGLRPVMYIMRMFLAISILLLRRGD
jgi:glycosyltransferase involved in cell wall biosynthesis